MKAFLQKAKKLTGILSIEGRDAVSSGLHAAADAIEPTEEQRRWAKETREELQTKKVEVVPIQA